jgi:EAL domain-containing protein (putative c-di-GMP-specific phosphodiesterase class I)
VALDDFGTGYSSLSYLRQFPFTKIKIDRSFIADLSLSVESVSIVKAIAGMAASLGIETTAEGVETDRQLDIVTTYGCTDVQGYLIAKPGPAADLWPLFEKHGSCEDPSRNSHGDAELWLAAS